MTAGTLASSGEEVWKALTGLGAPAEALILIQRDYVTEAAALWKATHRDQARADRRPTLCPVESPFGGHTDPATHLLRRFGDGWMQVIVAVRQARQMLSLRR